MGIFSYTIIADVHWSYSRAQCFVGDEWNWSSIWSTIVDYRTFNNFLLGLFLFVIVSKLKEIYIKINNWSVSSTKHLQLSYTFASVCECQCFVFAFLILSRENSTLCMLRLLLSTVELNSWRAILKCQYPTSCYIIITVRLLESWNISSLNR